MCVPLNFVPEASASLTLVLTLIIYFQRAIYTMALFFHHNALRIYYYYYHHFIVEEAEAQRGSTVPKVPQQGGEKSELEPKFGCFLSQSLLGKAKQ